jgi:hypothetical protein
MIARGKFTAYNGLENCIGETAQTGMAPEFERHALIDLMATSTSCSFGARNAIPTRPSRNVSGGLSNG